MLKEFVSTGKPAAMPITESDSMININIIKQSLILQVPKVPFSSSESLRFQGRKPIVHKVQMHQQPNARTKAHTSKQSPKLLNKTLRNLLETLAPAVHLASTVP